MPAIQYLKRSEINDEKWNACIDAAPNGLIYCYSFYLDALCTAWDALVLEDYQAIMPLPWRKKWGIYYLYTPFAVAQLGLFGSHVTARLLDEFLKKIPAYFQYWDVPLNFGNVFELTSFPLYKRKNYVLPLHPTYQDIQLHYRSHIKRNLKKARDQNCKVQKNVEIDDVIALSKQHKNSWGTAIEYEHFKNLYQNLAQKKQAITYAVKNTTGSILASAVFFFSHRRAYYILPGNHPGGRLLGASHLLLDQFIQDHACQNIVLDFEGSDIPGLQFFYS